MSSMRELSQYNKSLKLLSEILIDTVQRKEAIDSQLSNELFSLLNDIEESLGSSSTMPRQLALNLFRLYVGLTDEFDLLSLEPRELLMIVARYEDILIRIFPIKARLYENDDDALNTLDNVTLRVRELELEVVGPARMNKEVNANSISLFKELIEEGWNLERGNDDVSRSFLGAVFNIYDKLKTESYYGTIDTRGMRPLDHAVLDIRRLMIDMLEDAEEI